VYILDFTIWATFEAIWPNVVYKREAETEKLAQRPNFEKRDYMFMNY
jgi:hypothetical protein